MKTEREAPVAPILVLGIGNLLLADDGVGLTLLEQLRRDHEGDPRVEFVDGGTQGLMLVGLLQKRQSLLLLDAVSRGSEPGHVHLVRDPEEITSPRGFCAHGGNASELLALARLLGLLPACVHLVGIEPAELCTRLGLSPAVERAVPSAAVIAENELLDMLIALHPKRALECTS